MSDKSIPLLLDQKIYSLQAIKRAAYDFTDRAFFEISIDDDEKAVISITLKENAGKETVQDFLNNILDHQVRFELELEFGTLRDIIAAQAFTNG